MVASTIPNSVTEDWAEAAPAAARTAKAIRDFFIASFSKVKHGAPVQVEARPVLRQQVQATSALHPDSPGQPPFGKLSLFHQRDFSGAKDLARRLVFRCTRTTFARRQSGRG